MTENLYVIGNANPKSFLSFNADCEAINAFQIKGKVPASLVARQP